MKLFEFHQGILARQNSRPYYKGTWEPLRMEMFRMLPFQYEKSGTDIFQMYQVISGASTDITDYFGGSNLFATTWTVGGGTFSSSTSDYRITSWSATASDYLTMSLGNILEDSVLHFSISGTFTGANLNYRIYKDASPDVLITEVTGKQTEFTCAIDTTAAYYLQIYAPGTSTIATGVPKCKITTLDINGDFITYNGGELFTPITRGLCYFKINEANGLYSDDVDVDTVNFLLNSWPTYITSLAGSPATFTTSGKDVTSFDSHASNGGIFYQSPQTNNIYVKKGDTLYFSFRDAGFAYGGSPGTLAFYFKYTSGTTLTGTDITRIDEGSNYISNIYSGSIAITQDGYGRVYTTQIAGGTVRQWVNSDVYKTYSDKCIKISISSSTDLSGIYYKGGFTQVLWKESNVRKSPASKVEIIGDERNGILVKEKITTAVRYSVKIKVTESEYEGLVYSLGCAWTITDQSGKVFTCNNLEIKDPEWYNGNGICEITFDDNISVFSLNNTAL